MFSPDTLAVEGAAELGFLELQPELLDGEDRLPVQLDADPRDDQDDREREEPGAQPEPPLGMTCHGRLHQTASET